MNVTRAMLQNLRKFAQWRVRACGGALEVDEVVNIAIERALDGIRKWNPKRVTLEWFLKGIIRSYVSDEAKKAVRRGRHVSADAAHAASYEDEVIEASEFQESVAAATDCARDDAELSTLVGAVLDGETKREEIAESLGWLPDRVSAARIKLQRRLVKKYPEKFAPHRKKRKRPSLHQGKEQ